MKSNNLDETRLKKESWYHGEISRYEAEARLLKEEEDGTFLVRKSPKGMYVLSVKCTIEDDSQVKHYIFNQDKINKKIYISKEFQYDSIPELIQEYKGSSKFALCSPLSKPCSKKLTSEGLFGKEFEIGRNRILKLEEIGEGFYSKVYKGILDNTVIAIKEPSNILRREEFIKEISVLKKLDHQNICKFYGICSTQEPFYIILEYVENGNLLKYLRGNILSENEILNICYQIADAMDYLHSRNIIHRDLAARNILIDKNNNIKVTDFGLARFKKKNQYIMKSEMGIPIKSTAPESLQTAIYTDKSDIWSYGILLIEITSKGEPLFKGLKSGQIKNFIKNNYKIRQPTDMPEKLYSIYLKCCKLNPEKRPSFKDIKCELDHNFTSTDNLTSVFYLEESDPLIREERILLTKKWMGLFFGTIVLLGIFLLSFSLYFLFKYVRNKRNENY